MATNIGKPATTQSSLGIQFSRFEESFRNEFDENAWNSYIDKINEYVNDLYVGTRRECISHNDNERTLKYSGKDIDRASMRLDFQRLFNRRQKVYWFHIGALIGSLVTGIIANWSFSDISNPNPSIWPWVILVLALVITIVLESLSFIKDMEP
jgi:hypothetical protein